MIHAVAEGKGGECVCWRRVDALLNVVVMEASEVRRNNKSSPDLEALHLEAGMDFGRFPEEQEGEAVNTEGKRGRWAWGAPTDHLSRILQANDKVGFHSVDNGLSL